MAATMYQMEPYLDETFEIPLPKCMYEVDNIHYSNYKADENAQSNDQEQVNYRQTYL